MHVTVGSIIIKYVNRLSVHYPLPKLNWNEMKQILLLLKFIIVSACVYRSNGVLVRFENGSEFEGRVEIQYHNHERGTVCDGGWNRNDTLVLCRQLGFESAKTTDEGYTTWFYSASCNGTSEVALEQCSNDTEWKSHEEDPGAYECASSNNAPNNKTQLFSCNIDFRLPSSEDGDNIYGHMPVTASHESTRMVLSSHHTTIIIQRETIWSIVGSVLGTIATVIVAVTAVITLLFMIYKYWKKNKSEREQQSNTKTTVECTGDKDENPDTKENRAQAQAKIISNKQAIPVK